MKPVVLTLAVLSAAIALPCPSPAQDAERPPFAVQPRGPEAGPVPAGSPEPENAPVPALGVGEAPDPDVDEALELRIEEALESHRRNRLLGSGLVAAGAAAIVGALVDWAGHNRLGMRHGAAGIMFGGASLVAWGADRHVAAHEALQRARHWQAQAPAAADGR